MASITLEVDNSQVARVVAAFEHRYGPKGGGETDGEFLKRHIADTVNRWVKENECAKVYKDAVANFIDLDIT